MSSVEVCYCYSKHILFHKCVFKKMTSWETGEKSNHNKISGILSQMSTILLAWTNQITSKHLEIVSPKCLQIVQSTENNTF